MKSRARQELDKDRDEILKMYGGRCMVCGLPSFTIHEIIPLSHGKVAMSKENRVVLCFSCHDWAHKTGTNISIPILQAKREEYLTRYQNVQNLQKEQTREGVSG
jgi:5-methylcytosine-specific restriction endonuclease McrA